MPAARPFHYLHSSTSNALIATRCKVDRGQVCLGSNIICTSNEYASAVGEHMLYMYDNELLCAPSLINDFQRWSALSWQHHGKVRRGLA